MNGLKKWMIILRAYSWPASVVPIGISAVYSYKKGWFNWFDFFLIFTAGVSLHLGANLLNTYYDYVNKVDDENSDDIGIVRGLIEPGKAFFIAAVIILISTFIGLWIVFNYKLYPLLIISTIGFFLAIFYTANPLSLKYKALGELVIFLCFGPLIVSGSVMIFAKKFILESLWLSLPSAFLIVNILLANNIRDDKSDSEKGIKTIVDLIGVESSKKLYLLLLFFSYISAMAFLKFSMASFIILFSLLFSIGLIKLIEKQDFVMLVRQTAAFVLMFGILFSVAISLSL